MAENTINYPNGANVRGVIGVFQYTSTVFGIVHHTTSPVNLYVDFVQVGNLSSGTPTVTRVKHVLVNSNSYFTTTVPPVDSGNTAPGFGYDAKYLGSNRFAILYRGVFTGDSPFALATTAFTINPTTYEVSGDGSGYRATPPTNHLDTQVRPSTFGFKKFNIAPIGTAGTEYWITSPNSVSDAATTVGCRRINTSTYTASYTSSGYASGNANYDVSGCMVTATEDGAGVIFCTNHDGDTTGPNIGGNIVSIRNSDNNETALVTINASSFPIQASPSGTYLGPGTGDQAPQGDDPYVVAETLTKWSSVFKSIDEDRYYHLEYDGGTFTRSFIIDSGTSSANFAYNIINSYPEGYRKLDDDHYVFVTQAGSLANEEHYYHFVEINNGQHIIQQSVGSETQNVSGVLGRTNNATCGRTYPSTDNHLFKVDSTTLLLFMTGSNATTPQGTYAEGTIIRVIRPT